MSERRSKYNAHPVDADGFHFDSLAEYHHYQMLKLMEQAGEIWNLKVHPRYLILDGFDHDAQHERPIFYEADFSYFDKHDKCTIVQDVKGMRTALYRLKRKMFLAKYPQIKFLEVAA